MFSNGVLFADESNNDIAFYAGKFDTKDEVGDDETNLFGLEHRNPNLFRETILFQVDKNFLLYKQSEKYLK